LRNTQITLDQFRTLSRGWGASLDVAENYIEMSQTLDRLGWKRIGEQRTPDTTTPTTLGAWASQVLVPLVKVA
jgi:hypothetical protein